MNIRGSGSVVRLAAVVALVFGAVTVYSGGNVLFGDDAARLAAGAYVGFVLWFNFIAGFFYVATGVGLWRGRRWAVLLAYLLALSSLAVYAAFGLHVWLGGAFEQRTVVAMGLRCAVWLAISWLAWKRVWSARA
ncbi:MAG: hypothetical protein ABI696_07605 [Rubrivivax sp.]